METPDERWEFEVAAWLHDCGKVTTPEYVVDKATKLETLYNRIHEIRMRFEILIRDAEIETYRKRLAGDADERLLMAELAETVNQMGVHPLPPALTMADWPPAPASPEVS